MTRWIITKVRTDILLFGPNPGLGITPNTRGTSRLEVAVANCAFPPSVIPGKDKNVPVPHWIPVKPSTSVKSHYNNLHQIEYSYNGKQIKPTHN